MDLQRESLNRDAGVAEELKRELEISLEVVAFITNIACKDAQQSAIAAATPSTPLSSPSSASSPRSANSSSSDRERDRDRNQQQNGSGGGGGLLRFPRPSGPTDRFITLASRLVQQRRQTSRERAGTTVQHSAQTRRVSMSSTQPPASVAAIAASTAASAAPPAPSFGLGFSNSSLLGLSVHCNAGAGAADSSRSSLTNSAPLLSSQSPNVHSRAVSNQEPLSHTQPQQQYTNPNQSHNSAANTGNLSHGYSSHQNLKSLLSKQQHQQLVNGPKLGGSGGSSTGGSSGTSSNSGGGPNSKQLQQQLGLAPQHSSSSSAHRAIPGGTSSSSSSDQPSHSAANTPVARSNFLTQTSAKPSTATAFVPFAASELPALLQSLSSDDLLLLHRRYTEDVHASIWSLLVSARQRSRTALSAVEHLVQEREEIARASADCVDLAYHYKQCLDATGATLGPAASASSAAAAMMHARSSTAGTTSSAATAPTDEFDPAPILALYHDLFPHALQPHRNWSELLSARHGSGGGGGASSASGSSAAAPSSSASLIIQSRSDVASGVSLLSELIEWHRRLMDASRIMEAQIAAGAAAGSSAGGGAPGGPTAGGSTTAKPGLQASAPFPIAVRPNAAELRKPDTSAVFVN